METFYQCSECGAEDRDHQSYTPPPSALICHNSRCRAGKGMSVSDQIMRQIGMLPRKEKIN